MLAFFIWGFTPFYWRSLVALGPIEIIAHRVVWCAIFMSLILSFTRQWKEVIATISNPIITAILFLSACLVSINWGMFVYSVTTDQLVASSLGYFLSPLVSVFLGFIFLKERPTARQWIAVLLATAAVITQLLAYGSLPWIALTIAFSFGLYGLIRKTVKAGSNVGLFVECLVIAPFGLGFLFWLESKGTGSFGNSEISLDILIILAGVITGVPLMFFAASARRIKLTTIGLFQYFTPSTYLVIAIWLFNEKFSINEWVSFCLLWLGLFIYTSEIWRTRQV